jgi:hypothetical protein
MAEKHEDHCFIGHRRLGISGALLAPPWQFTSPRLRLLKSMSSPPSFLPTYRRRLWRRLCRPPKNLRLHQKIFLCRSRRRRPISSRSMWKRQPLHQRNLRLKNSRPLRRRKLPVARARCRSLQPKLWQPMRRVLNIHMRRVPDTLRAAESCVVEVGPSGSVTSASMATSIGNPILDNAATSAFQTVAI